MPTFKTHVRLKKWTSATADEESLELRKDEHWLLRSTGCVFEHTPVRKFLGRLGLRSSPMAQNPRDQGEAAQGGLRHFGGAVYRSLRTSLCRYRKDPDGHRPSRGERMGMHGTQLRKRSTGRTRPATGGV